MICTDCGSDTGSEAARHATPQDCIRSWRAVAGYAMAAVMAAKKKILRCRIMGHRGHTRPRAFEVTIQGRKEVLEICDRCVLDGFVGNHIAGLVFEVLEKKGVRWNPTSENSTAPSDGNGSRTS